jgi:hypothetical protein
MLSLQQKTNVILKRRAFFDLHFAPIEGCDAFDNLSNSCPSCGYMTLVERCGLNVCPFCYWKDDGQDNADADEVSGGPNDHYSLTVHREELFDWMTALKKRKQEDGDLESKMGQELTRLDELMQASTIDKPAILDQIALLSECFDENRNSKHAHSKNDDF